MNYFISDTHFGHERILTHDNRPFLSIEEMDNEMIKRWNNRVTKQDTVYILGDFSWYNAAKSIEILKQLNGRKRLIKGNHDRIHSAEFKKCFESIKDYDEIKLDGQKIILCHYSIPFYNSHYYGAIMLHGHTHNSHEHQMELVIEKKLNQLDMPCRFYNVGAMLPYMDFTPRTLEEIIKGKEQYMQQLDKNTEIE